ncbi:pilus assembly protein [Heyndrickxia sporothermodurans]
MKRIKYIKNEKGALSIEFLGILPFYFLLFLFLWQVVASGYAVFIAKTAVNEAVKAYSLNNGDMNIATQKAKQVLGNSSVIEFKDLQRDSSYHPGKKGEFKLILKTKHPLVFIPDKWKNSSSLPLEQSAVGMELVP